MFTVMVIVTVIGDEKIYVDADLFALDNFPY